MKRVLAVTALATTLLATGSAFAAGSTAGCSAVTRGDVLNELQEWKKDPVAADGARWVGGQVGWSGDASRASASNAGNAAAIPAAKADLQLVRGELGWVSVQNDLRILPATPSTQPVIQSRGNAADNGWCLAFGEVGVVPSGSTNQTRSSPTGCVAEGFTTMAHAAR